jgi:hypothetical protein
MEKRLTELKLGRLVIADTDDQGTAILIENGTKVRPSRHGYCRDQIGHQLRICGDLRHDVWYDESCCEDARQRANAQRDELTSLIAIEQLLQGRIRRKAGLGLKVANIATMNLDS